MLAKARSFTTSPRSSATASPPARLLAMAMVMDQQHAEHQLQQQPLQTFKHHCRICKKGFSCGRALGGHMRAHGIVDDSAAETDDDISGCGGASEWDDKHNAHAGTKRMYALRTNPNRLKSCRVCENCGKEFVSWKSFLEHGKCISDDEEEGMGEGYGLGYDDDGSLPSSPRSAEDVVGCLGWSKGKRSRRTKVVLSEEENLANCLVLLSSARVEPASLVETTEESCASASRDDDRRQQTAAFPAPAMEVATKATPVFAALPPAPNVPRGMFECKACKKVFSSHQALGGHRASHKKVKGCFAAKLDETAPEEVVTVAHDHNFASASVSVAMVPFENKAAAATGPAAPPLKKKAKVHECSICHRVFASGQALGGHKRCHWITSNAADPNLKLQPLPLPDNATLPPHLTLRPLFDAANSKQLDLNMPAPVDESTRREIGSSLRLEMPAAIFLRSWIGTGNVSKKRANMSGDRQHNKIIIHSKDNHTTLPSFNVEEEVDSKLKLAKLSDLKDMNMGGESSPWLQVGIGSSPANDGSEA